MAASSAPVRSSVATRPAPRPAPPRLRVVDAVRHPRRYLLASLLVLVAGVFGVVSLNALAAEAAFTARTLEADVEELATRYDELTAEVASLSDPARIRSVAVDELGMVPADEPAFLVVERPPAAHEPARTEAAVDAGSVTDPVKHALDAGR